MHVSRHRLVLTAIGTCFIIAFLVPNIPGLTPRLKSTEYDKAFSVTEVESHSATAGTSPLVKELQSAQIIPDVVDGIEISGDVMLTVKYGESEVINGMSLTPQQAANAPIVEILGQDLYTLVMVDPDAPSPQNPSVREWLHWMVVNIPQGSFTEGETVVTYSAPTPPEGRHRYVVLLYKNTEGEHIKVPPPAERGRFQARELSRRYNLGNPIAATYFYSEKQ